MKTATVRQLRNEYSTLMRWLSAGEEIILTRRGITIARLVPEKHTGKSGVDWSKSPAVRRNRSRERIIDDKQSKEIINESGGEW